MNKRKGRSDGSPLRVEPVESARLARAERFAGARRAVVLRAGVLRADDFELVERALVLRVVLPAAFFGLAAFVRRLVALSLALAPPTLYRPRTFGM